WRAHRLRQSREGRAGARARQLAFARQAGYRSLVRIGRLLVLGVGLWRLQPGDLFEVLGAQIARRPWLAGVPVVSAILINHNGQSTSAGSAVPPQPGLCRAARRIGCSHYGIACREPDNQGAGAVGSLAVDRPPPENGILRLGMMRRLKATCQLAVPSGRLFKSCKITSQSA